MKFILSTLTVAAMATMGMADEIFPPTGDQTNKVRKCMGKSGMGIEGD